LVNIDKRILEFCKEPKKYGEIGSLSEELDRSESAIKKHITKLRDRKYLIQDKLTKEYQTNPHIENLDDNLKRQIILGNGNESKYNGLESEMFYKIRHDELIGASIRLPDCLTNYPFPHELTPESAFTIFELLRLVIFENLTFYDQIKKPGDYNFDISITLNDGENKDRFNLLREYHKETIKKKFDIQEKKLNNKKK